MKCKAVKFLDNIRGTQENYDCMARNLEECRNRLDVMGYTFNMSRGGSSEAHGRIPKVYDAYAKLCQDIEEEIGHYNVLFNHYREFIFNLHKDGYDPGVITMIELHWLHGLPWSEIEAITPYTAEGARCMAKRVLKQAGDCVPPDAG